MCDVIYCKYILFRTMKNIYDMKYKERSKEDRVNDTSKEN